MTVLNDVLEIDSITVKPWRNDEVEGVGSGQIIRAELTTPLWSVEISSPLTLFEDGRRIRAIMNDLDRPGQVFDVYDPISQYPINDPDGSILGASAVTINANNGDGTISLKGLPVGYKIAVGDCMQIDFGSQRGYFEASQDATANGAGITAAFRVFPAIRAAILANTPVILKQPKIQCQFVPDSIEYGSAESSNWKMTGFRFSAVQKI